LYDNGQLSQGFPDDSGPYTSTIRPFGYPPIPNAESIANDPEDTASTLIGFSDEISIIAPFPYSFSITFIASLMAA